MMRLVLLVLVLAAAHRPADACSVGPTFMPPSNFELVATTPRIVVAKALKAIVPANRDDDDYGIELEVTASIKGTNKIGERVRVRGSTIRYLGASKKDDFSRARKGAYAGSCTAWDYKIGKSYVLFLEQYRGKWDTAGVPFARVNEEVDDKADPWTLAVIEYARIAALPKLDDRKRALEALAKKSTALKADIAAHFATPTPHKSFAELDVMYRAASPQERNRIALAIGLGGDQAAKAFMKDLVAATRDGTAHVDRGIALDAIDAYYLKVSDPPVLGQIAEMYVALGSKAKQERWDVMWLLIKKADASHVNVMERALAGADDEEVGRLVEFFAKIPSETARKEVRRRIGNNFATKWEMTLGLAGLGDKDVIAWAKQKLAAKPPSPGQASPIDDTRWIALYAIAMSPLPEADALVPGVIAKGGKDLESLVQGYEKAFHTRADARLAEIAKRKLDAETKKWLDRTVESRASR